MTGTFLNELLGSIHRLNESVDMLLIRVDAHAAETASIARTTKSIRSNVADIRNGTTAADKSQRKSQLSAAKRRQVNEVVALFEARQAKDPASRLSAASHTVFHAWKEAGQAGGYANVKSLNAYAWKVLHNT